MRRIWSTCRPRLSRNKEDMVVCRDRYNALFQRRRKKNTFSNFWEVSVEAHRGSGVTFSSSPEPGG